MWSFGQCALVQDEQHLSTAVMGMYKNLIMHTFQRHKSVEVSSCIGGISEILLLLLLDVNTSLERLHYLARAGMATPYILAGCEHFPCNWDL